MQEEQQMITNDDGDQLFEFNCAVTFFCERPELFGCGI